MGVEARKRHVEGVDPTSTRGGSMDRGGGKRDGGSIEKSGRSSLLASRQW